MKKLLACLMILTLAVSPALAESITLDGTVISTETIPVMSAADGVLNAVFWQVGYHVDADEEAVSLYSVGVYADQPGTVKVMGAEGESVAALAARYGAVLYIEPDCQYTISANVNNAYDDIANKIIHPGEIVYLRCNSNGEHTGVGVVTSVSGNSYAVEVTEGIFESGEIVQIFRNEACSQKARIGRGSASHASPVAYAGTGTGRVYSVNVEDGAHVETGDLLYRTIETENTYRISSDVAGTVAAVRVAPGDAVTVGAVVADIYPDEAMRLEIAVPENDLRNVRIGTKVSIEFTGGETTEGEIDWISSVAQANLDEEDDVYFTAYVRFDATETVRYGMTAKVTTVEEGAQE